MTTLQTYSTFRPTSYDAAGLGCPDQQDWLVAPVTICPNVAECADESNWQAQLNALSEVDPDGNDHEVCWFGHWATPFDIVLVRPGTPAAECAAELAERLENYPLLNEDDLSEREDTEAFENVARIIGGMSLEYADGSNVCEGEAFDALISDVYAILSERETPISADTPDVAKALLSLGWSERKESWYSVYVAPVE
jgi:hypothetical protein